MKTILLTQVRNLALLGIIACVPLVDLNASLVFQFQEGLEGYEGTADTSIRGRSSSGNTDQFNYGGSTTMTVRNSAHSGTTGEYVGGNQNNWTSVVRFDDIFGTNPGQIDPNVEILGATLKLTAISRTANTAAREIRVGAMMKPFEEGTGTGSFQPGTSAMLWQYAPSEVENPAESEQDGTPWSHFIPASEESPNQRHYGGPAGGTEFYHTGDFNTSFLIFEEGEHPGGTTTITLSDPHLYEIDITPFVIAWQQGDIPNHGIYLYHTQSGATVVPFATSEYTDDPDFRPMLEIVTVPEPAVISGLTGLGLLILFLGLRLKKTTRT